MVFLDRKPKPAIMRKAAATRVHPKNYNQRPVRRNQNKKIYHESTKI